MLLQNLNEHITIEHSLTPFRQLQRFRTKSQLNFVIAPVLDQHKAQIAEGGAALFQTDSVFPNVPVKGKEDGC